MFHKNFIFAEHLCPKKKAGKNQFKKRENEEKEEEEEEDKYPPLSIVEINDGDVIEHDEKY
jgi:hypothetical protein